MRFLVISLCLLAFCPARAADPLVDSAVVALSQLTDPHRLALLPEDDFRAQLGPALGWLNVARHRDVSPESVIARALASNGLDGERARLTREALLRNLARADAWELFAHFESTRALSVGAPAPIPTGIHQGFLARATVILPDGLSPQDRREFACLVLRADDENPPPPPRHGSHRRHAGDLLARNELPVGRGTSGREFSPPPAAAMAVRTVSGEPPAGPEDALPIHYATRGQDNGTVAVRETVTVGQEVPLAAWGGPALRFVWRGMDGGAARFELIDDASGGTPRRVFAMPRLLAATGPSWKIYEQPGALRISLPENGSVAEGAARSVLFEFPPGPRVRETK